jgi:hypothetical protein
MWWQDLLWGLWHGLAAWIVLDAHIFGGWEDFPFYDCARSGNWYVFGFLIGAGSPLLGALGGRDRTNCRRTSELWRTCCAPCSAVALLTPARWNDQGGNCCLCSGAVVSDGSAIGGA